MVEPASQPSSACHLLEYNFLLSLVAEHLNDGDVLARLLTLNKSVKSILRKYPMKRICDTDLALAILEADPEIALSVTRVKANNTVEQHDKLLEIAANNPSQLTEVHYHHDCLVSPRSIPPFVTHLCIGSFGRHLLSFSALSIPDSVVDLWLDGELSDADTVTIPSSVRALKMKVVTGFLASGLNIPTTVDNLSMVVRQTDVHVYCPHVSLTCCSRLNYSGATTSRRYGTQLFLLLSRINKWYSLICQ
jgi:hypothetical protein